MAYNSTIDKDTDDILIYGNTAKDGSGTSYVPLLDADGHTQVDVLSNALPTGASTLAEQQSQTTHLATVAGDTTSIQTAVELIDDAVYTDGAGTVTKGIAILGQDGTNPQAIKTDASGELQVDVLTMPTVAVTQSGTWDEVGINDSGNSITVDNPQLSVVGSGTEATAMRVTIATDSTGVLSVDDNGSTLSIDDGAGSITVDGTVTANLAAGTNNIGDVDVLSIVPGTAATNLGKAEDAAHTTGDTGVMALAVRRDTSAASSGTTGDYEPLSTDATGKLWIVGTGIEDAAETAGGVLNMMGAVRRDTAASSSGTTGDNSTLNTDAVGKLWVTGTVLEDVAHSAGEQLNPTGVRRIDTPATSSGTSGDWSTMDASAEGALWTTLTPTTTGGLTIHKTDALVATAVAVKASAGNIYGYHIFNPNTADIYIHVYNIAQGSVTVGTSSRTISMLVPGGGVLDGVFPMPLGFSTAITVAATTTLTGSSAPGTGLVTNIYYK